MAKDKKKIKGKEEFDIGDRVVAKVSKRGSSEPSFCRVGEVMTVDKIEKTKAGIIYVCTMDGYRFSRDELMSPEEYLAQCGVNTKK